MPRVAARRNRFFAGIVFIVPEYLFARCTRGVGIVLCVVAVVAQVLAGIGLSEPPS